MLQIFSHLQTDETATYDKCTSDLMLSYVVFYTVGVLYITQRKDSTTVDTCQRKTYRGGSGRKQEFVVSFHIFPTVRCSYRNFFSTYIYCRHLGYCTDIHTETTCKSLRSLHEKPLSITDHSTYIIR